MPFVIAQPRRGVRAALALAAPPWRSRSAPAPPRPPRCPTTTTPTSSPGGDDGARPRSPPLRPPTSARPRRSATPSASGATNDYTLVPGGDMEDGAPGWTLGSGAELFDATTSSTSATAPTTRRCACAPALPRSAPPSASTRRTPRSASSPRGVPPLGPQGRGHVVGVRRLARRHAAPRQLDRPPVVPVAPIALPSEHLSGDALEPVQFRFTVDRPVRRLAASTTSTSIRSRAADPAPARH